MPPSLEIDQVIRIEIGDPVNDDNDDGDANRYHGRAVHPEHVTPVTVDPHAILRSIRPGDTVTAAAYDRETLGALLTPADADGSVEVEQQENWQSTLGYTASTNIEQ
ncbi:hypothetical protein B4589_004700 [Halolamina sp. CBA1230]|uniref:hypothetical protein n=1 Tax=Halolamina sp. CBA1230 TaxID=1853690 RepID=UPI0009A14474|nr:hypothetical protein [Halolamina sp. CBA1230]QKY19712.1 hypothetical protein B4589_004700 [Halolamina sp. CBA1230]